MYAICPAVLQADRGLPCWGRGLLAPLPAARACWCPHGCRVLNVQLQAACRGARAEGAIRGPRARLFADSGRCPRWGGVGLEPAASA